MGRRIAPDPAVEISVTPVRNLRPDLGYPRRNAGRSAREARGNPVDVFVRPAGLVIVKLGAAERRRFRSAELGASTFRGWGSRD